MKTAATGADLRSQCQRLLGHASQGCSGEAVGSDARVVRTGAARGWGWCLKGAPPAPPLRHRSARGDAAQGRSRRMARVPDAAAGALLG